MPVFLRNSSLHSARERGASLIESVLCLISLILAGLAVFEITQWHITRHLARLAAHAAGRQGAITQANPQAIWLAADAILSPGAAAMKPHASVHPSPFAPPPPPGERPSSDFARSARRRAIAGMRSWHLEILSPTTAMFSDFSDELLSRAGHRPTIRNDFLAEQHADNQARGWANGLGPVSGKDIFQANTLRLRLTVLYAPLVPGIGMIVRMMPPTGDRRADHAHRRGMLSIVIEADTAMHSHPIFWTETPGDVGGTITADKTARSNPPTSGDLPDGTNGPSRSGAQSPTPGEMIPYASKARPDLDRRTAARPSVTGSPIAPAAAVSTPDALRDPEALCGTLLCCPPK